MRSHLLCPARYPAAMSHVGAPSAFERTHAWHENKMVVEIACWRAAQVEWECARFHTAERKGGRKGAKANQLSQTCISYTRRPKGQLEALASWMQRWARTC
eukprot:2023065-Rhodomonas_salina.1